MVVVVIMLVVGIMVGTSMWIADRLRVAQVANVLLLNPPTKTGNPFDGHDGLLAQREVAHRMAQAVKPHLPRPHPALTLTALEEFLRTTRDMPPALQAEHFAFHFPHALSEEASRVPD